MANNSPKTQAEFYVSMLELGKQLVDMLVLEKAITKTEGNKRKHHIDMALPKVVPNQKKKK